MPDPLVALRSGPVRVQNGGAVRMFRNASAREWINLDSIRVASLYFALEDRRELIRDVASGRMNGEELAGWSHKLAEALTGWKWWEVNTLLVTSGSRGVLGRLTLAGIDPDGVTLGQWCSAVWAVLTENLDAKGVQRLETELSLPPEGYEAAWDDDEEYYQAMLAQASQFGA